jgi:hypothetical protein
MKLKMKNSAVVAASLAGLLSVLLLLSDHGLLIWERFVSPGQRYELKDYGDLGADGQASLVCSYFTGRGVAKRVFWHSGNDIMGKNACPFLLKL